jgi:hypothetical protein
VNTTSHDESGVIAKLILQRYRSRRLPATFLEFRFRGGFSAAVAIFDFFHHRLDARVSAKIPVEDLCHASGQLGASFFSPRQRLMLVFFRKESGGFAAADRLTRLSEMVNDFVSTLVINDLCFDAAKKSQN